jgi:hypothetical protein
MRDLISNTRAIKGAPQTLSGTTPNNSAAFDRSGFDALSLYLETGAITDAGTAAGFTLKLQHSDTLVGADFVDCSAADVLNGPTVSVVLDTEGNKVAGGLGYVGGKTYVRGVFTGTTGTAAVVNLFAVLGKPYVAPTATAGVTLATT